MKIKDVEAAIRNFCAKEDISIVNGFIDPQHLNKVEIFLDVLKVTRKSQAKFLRLEPQKVGEILKNMKISKQ